MMSLLAILLVTALFAAVTALVLLARARPGLIAPLTSAAAVALVVLGFYHTGGLGTVDKSILGSSDQANSPEMAEQCDKLTVLLRQGGVVRDAPGKANSVIISAKEWAQLPAAAQSVAKSCLAKAKGIEPDALVLVES